MATDDTAIEGEGDAPPEDVLLVLARELRASTVQTGEVVQLLAGSIHRRLRILTGAVVGLLLLAALNLVNGLLLRDIANDSQESLDIIRSVTGPEAQEERDRVTQAAIAQIITLAGRDFRSGLCDYVDDELFNASAVFVPQDPGVGVCAPPGEGGGDP